MLTPYKGTPLYDQLAREDRLLEDRGWEYHNGYNVTYRPRLMGSAELLDAHRELWRRAFSPSRAAARMARAVRQLRPGAAMMSACMNGFYGWKRLRHNEPVDMRTCSEGPVREVSSLLSQVLGQVDRRAV